MADNIPLTPGSGVTYSTEEVTTLNGGSVSAQHVGRSGLTLITADGTAVDVKTANPLPISDADGSLTVDGTVAISGTVAVTDNSGSLTVDGTVAATQSGTWNITNVSGTVSLPTGAATAAAQATANTHLATLAGAVSGTEVQVDIVSGGLTISKPSTATITTVADATSSATLKASNSSRLGIIIWNDSSEILYIKYGTTASSTDWTYKLAADEVLREDSYTGRIDGIWAANGSGSARITELTA